MRPVTTAPVPVTGGGMFETYDCARWRYLWHLCDAVLTAGIDPPVVGAQPTPARRGIKGSYRRAQLVISAAAARLPRAFARLRSFLLHPARVPFAVRRVELLSAGSGVTVYTLGAPEADHAAHVLKIYRKSLGQRLDTLLAQAEDRRARYNMLAGWYADCGVVLPTQFLVLHGPVLGLPALGYVQPYVNGDPIDVFHDLSELELLRILRDDPPLLEQFRRFAERTLRVMREQRLCVDIVGSNNLVIAQLAGQRRLVLLDYGILDVGNRALGRNTLRELRHRLAYLRRFQRRIQEDFLPLGG
jgi:hypothetical protein